MPFSVRRDTRNALKQPLADCTGGVVVAADVAFPCFPHAGCTLGNFIEPAGLFVIEQHFVGKIGAVSLRQYRQYKRR